MATLVRAVVMLSVQVGLPAAWIYYGPLPPQAQRVVDRFVAVVRDAAGWGEAASRKASSPAEVSYQLPAPTFALSEANGRVAAGDESKAARPPAAPALIPPRAATFAERVEPLLAKLRQLGVAEYALERWGDGGTLYRFHCEMPLGASDEFTQQFEAVAVDPQLSVEQVVAQVSEWQLTHRSAGM